MRKFSLFVFVFVCRCPFLKRVVVVVVVGERRASFWFYLKFARKSNKWQHENSVAKSLKRLLFVDSSLY